MKAAVFTINTRAYEQKKSSKTGAALKTTLEQIGFEVKEGVLPEDKTVVAAVMKQLADSEAVQLIITTGAVGYLKKDCAPGCTDGSGRSFTSGDSRGNPSI